MTQDQRSAARVAVVGLTFCCLMSLSLQACGGGEKAAYGTPVHVCEVLPVSQLEPLLGASVDQTPREMNKEQEDDGFWMSMCSYFASQPGISVSLMLQPFPQNRQTPDDALDAYVDGLKGTVPDLQLSTVDGVGARAFWLDSSHQLTVFDRNRHMLIVTVMMKENAQQTSRQLSEKLAAAFLEKL